MLKINSSLFKTNLFKYTLFGVIFGTFFPIIALFLLDQPKVLFSIISTAPLFLGIFSSYAGLLQDRTQKQVDFKTRELRKQKNLFELILNNMSEGVLAVDQDNHFIVWNKESEKMIGMCPISKSPDQWTEYYGAYQSDQKTLIPSESFPLFKAVQGIESQNISLYIQNEFIKEGRFLEASGRTLRDQGKIIGGVVVFKDITQKRKKDKELLEAKLQAEEKSQTRTKFLTHIGHEIRNPVNAIHSCTNLLMDHLKKEENRNILETIQQSSEKLITLINDILDFSKLEDGKIELENHSFNLVESVKDIIELLAPKAKEKEVTIFHHFSQEIPMEIQGDVIRFKQLVTNLVGNAIKFARKEVKIEIAVHHIENDRYEIQFSIADDGGGIPEKMKFNLFQDFDTLDSSSSEGDFKGTELGLAICKNIIEAMGGEIWAESQLDKGSLFCFKITVNKKDNRQKAA